MPGPGPCVTRRSTRWAWVAVACSNGSPWDLSDGRGGSRRSRLRVRAAPHRRRVLASATGGDFSEGDVRRVRLYQGLERTGLPLDAIREALDAGELSFGWLDHPLYALIAPLSPGRSATSPARPDPPDLLMVVREAIGFALPDPDDPMREDGSASFRWSGSWSRGDSLRPSWSSVSASTATRFAGSPKPKRNGGAGRSRCRAWPRD